MLSSRLLMTLVAVAATPASALAQAQTFTPTGPYSVGTTRLVMVDSSRSDMSGDGPSAPRRLVVQFWYPADPAPGTPTAPFVPEYEALERDLREAYPELELDSVRTSALWNAEPLAGSRFPLLVLSHGMNSARFFYTSLAQQLASHGFVVAALDHPFWALAVSFPDGGRQPLSDGMSARDWLSSDEIDALMEDGIRSMAADQAFVAKRLTGDGTILGATIDARRVGVLGHSMGGMAATQACWTYRVFSACASLDGLVWTREGLSPIGEPPNRVGKPFLLLVSPQFLPDDLSTAVTRYRRVWKDPSLCLVRGTRHNSFTDLPLLRGTPPAEGELEPATATSLIQSAVVAFFQSSLDAARPATSPPVRCSPGTTPLDSAAAGFR